MVSAGSAFSPIQAITTESLRVAQRAADASTKVTIHAVQFENEETVVPEFNTFKSLKRSVLDIAKFTQSHPYPLISDIVDIVDSIEADYVVYSNMDIILMPQFYNAVSVLLRQGFDSLIINRRRISGQFNKVSELPLIYSEIGYSHPGFDCFVFKKKLLDQFVLENVCVGVPFIGVTLAHNIFAFSNNYKLIDEQHLTTHIGLEVMPIRNKEYHDFNRREFHKVQRQLKPFLSANKLPYNQLPLYRKIIKWGLNPSVFIAFNLRLETVGFWQKMKMLYQEVRFRLLGKL